MTTDGSTPPDAAGAGDGDGSFDGGETLEAAVVVLSAVLIVGLLGYLLLQAVVGPGSPDPTATVESVEPLSSNGDRLQVTVALVNEGDTGLESVEVQVRCGGTERSLVFTQVPAQGHRTGTAVCPAGSSPTASVATWVEG